MNWSNPWAFILVDDDVFIFPASAASGGPISPPPAAQANPVNSNLTYVLHTDNYLFSISSLAATSEASNHAVSNLYGIPVTRTWRSASLATQDISIVLNTSLPVNIVALVNHNLSSSATITVDAGSTSAVSDYSTAIPWRELTAFLALIPSQTYRFWRIRITDSSNSNGYIQVGYLMIGQLTQLSQNFRTEWKNTTEWTTQDGRSPYNVPFYERRAQQQHLLLNFNPLTDTEMTDLRTLYAAAGRNRIPFLLLPVYGGDDAYFGRWQNPFSEKIDFYRDVALDFREDAIPVR